MVGNIYISNTYGTEYTLSLRNNVRSLDSSCDFEKIKSTEGFYLANIIDEGIINNPKIKKKENYKQTRITFNKGGNWIPLKAPFLDSKN